MPLIKKVQSLIRNSFYKIEYKIIMNITKLDANGGRVCFVKINLTIEYTWVAFTHEDYIHNLVHSR